MSVGAAKTGSGFLSKIKTFDAFRYYRNFRFLWICNLSYQIGMWTQTLVMGWLVYNITESAFSAAMFAAARLSPYLLGPFTGAIGDRVDRVKLMISAQILQLGVATTLAILSYTGSLNFPLLLVMGFFGGVVWSFTYTTSSTVAMDIVGQEHITNAIALNTVAMNITSAIGPAIGGVLLSTLGPTNCFLLVASLEVPALTSLIMIKMPARKSAVPKGSAWHNLAEGYRYIISKKGLLAVMAVSLISNIFIWPAFQSFMPVFAKDNLSLGPSGLGFLQMTYGIGAFSGAVTIASIGNFNWKGKMYLVGTALFGIFFGTFAITRSFPLALVLVGISGMFSATFAAMQSTLTLLQAPPEMRSRCMGFLGMSIGILPFGCLALGAAANAIGAGLTTAIACAMMVLCLVAEAFFLPEILKL